MTTDRPFSNHLHSRKDRPRFTGLALVFLIAALFAVPAGALAAGDDEYIPSSGQGGNGGGGGGGNDRGSFSVPGADQGAVEPAPVEEGPVEPVDPVGATPEKIAAQKKAEKEAEARREAKKEKERQEKLIRQQEKEAKEAAAAAAADEPPAGTRTAAEVARTAFADGDAGPLPIVIGVLLLVTGIGLVVRYRRTGPTGA